MGMSTGRGAEEPIVDINIAPLVDICLVLVIIFMVTVPIMMTQSPVEVILPLANTIEPREDVNITVAIDPNDSAAVDADKCKIQDLPMLIEKVVKEKGTDKMVIIRADKEVYHQRVLEIMDIAKKLNCERISVATTQGKEETIN